MGEMTHCPFCGSLFVYIERDVANSTRPDYFIPCCGECGANIDGAWETEQEALDAWNRRA